MAVAFFAGAAGVGVTVAVVAAALRLATVSATDFAAVATNTARVASRLRVKVSTCFSNLQQIQIRSATCFTDCVKTSFGVSNPNFFLCLGGFKVEVQKLLHDVD